MPDRVTNEDISAQIKDWRQQLNGRVVKLETWRDEHQHWSETHTADLSERIAILEHRTAVLDEIANFTRKTTALAQRFVRLMKAFSYVAAGIGGFTFIYGLLVGWFR